MGKVMSEISMSLDGFITGPNVCWTRCRSTWYPCYSAAVSGSSRISTPRESNCGGQVRSRHRAPPTSDSKLRSDTPNSDELGRD